MTIEDVIKRGMECGAPFPAILDWTFGEVVDFIECKQTARKTELREQAVMDFHLANTICKMLSAKKGTKISVMEEYDFLWSQEDRNAAAIANFERQMLARCNNINK